ncbi:MAG: divergent polysaccharide deacetylase family protein [Pseudomonadota bacterium]
MGRGVLSGLIWGSLFSLMILVMLSLVAPFPQGIASEQRDVAGAAPLTASPADSAPVVADATTDPVDGGDGQGEAVLSDLDVPATSEFRRGGTDLDPALPEVDESPSQVAAAFPESGDRSDLPTADTAPATAPQTTGGVSSISAPDETETPLPSATTGEDPQASRVAEPAEPLAPARETVPATGQTSPDPARSTPVEPGELTIAERSEPAGTVVQSTSETGNTVTRQTGDATAAVPAESPAAAPRETARRVEEDTRLDSAGSELAELAPQDRTVAREQNQNAPVAANGLSAGSAEPQVAPDVVEARIVPDAPAGVEPTELPSQSGGSASIPAPDVARAPQPSAGAVSSATGAQPSARVDSRPVRPTAPAWSQVVEVERETDRPGSRLGDQSIGDRTPQQIPQELERAIEAEAARRAEAEPAGQIAGQGLTPGSNAQTLPGQSDGIVTAQVTPAPTQPGSSGSAGLTIVPRSQQPSNNPAQVPATAGSNAPSQTLPGVISPDASASLPGTSARRLPGILGRDQAETEEAATPADAIEPATALGQNAAEFSNPDGLPMLGIVLTNGDGPWVDASVLSQLPFPVTVAIDPTIPDALAFVATYRQAGLEVLMQAKGLPTGATPQDVEVTFSSQLTEIPGTIGIIDVPQGGLSASRDLAAQAVALLQERGLGLVLYDQGLNAAKQEADRAGLPSALVYRTLDASDTGAITRTIDRAAFQAARDGAVLIEGSNSIGTIEAITKWATGLRARNFSLAPASAVMQR